MKKILIVCYFSVFCFSALVANDCVKINGDVRCDYDVFTVYSVPTLLRVHNIGGGQVQWELYYYNEDFYKEDSPAAIEANTMYYQEFKLGRVKKLGNAKPQHKINKRDNREIVGNDCFKMNGDIHCNNDVYKTPLGYCILKVNALGGGRMSWNFYHYSMPSFKMAKQASDLEGSIIQAKCDEKQLRAGKVKRIYSDTKVGREIFFQAVSKKQKLVVANIDKCKIGARKNAKGNKEAELMLIELCEKIAYSEVSFY